MTKFCYIPIYLEPKYIEFRRVVYIRLSLFEQRYFQGGVLLLPSCQKYVDYIVPAFLVF